MQTRWSTIKGTLATWAVPLRLHLSVIILALLAVTALPIVWITYTQGRFAALSTGEAQMRQLGLRTIEDYRNVFKGGYTAVLTASAVPEMLTAPPNDLKAKQDFLLKALQSSFRVDGIYAGYPDGGFVQALGVAADPEFRGNLNAPAQAAYAVRVVSRVDGPPSTIWTFYDKEMRLLNRRADRDDMFDPRVRPWYLAAVGEGRTVSVGPYVSASTHFLTMTIATPSGPSNRVVIGADVMLVTLGAVVDVSALSEHARGYVFDQKGGLIVHSDKDVMNEVRRRLRAGQEVSVATLAQADPTLPVVTNLLTSDRSLATGAVVRFPVNGHDYLAQVFREGIASLRGGYTVVIAAPLEELVGPVERRLKRNLAIAAAFLATGVLIALVISRLVSRSLYRLADEATHMGKLEFGESRIAHSWISEVNVLAKALSSARHAIRTFSVYVPRELVRRIVIAGQSAVGTAVRQDITVLFTDIRDFTTISEENSPEEVVALLSGYFETLNEVVERHGGTIVQYMGDGVLAMWNAPLHDPRHVENGCYCALAMKAAIDAMNAANAADGRPLLITRFGLHTGQAVVGSVGAETRRQYTAIGDTVNIASRLEGLNRQYGTSILVSGAVRDAVGEMFELVAVGIVSVKGRTGQTELFELRA
ncbi:adenylate/guanylate cyclase domain-containing protein [Rhizobium sp. P32RR-XVIII]|uniref:adenylate/guanylate cyclase domain-containing protein n=1 Tax=Rhizobium sp. P32RR-XVIII TaxID=2726738 RepID=UPI0014575E8C|nr:adenylate/guanylate cyclase domain-containing protein [Rhizobium sp. P32RR-XVIII]NLS05024.1 adenylate/guanylate cyclase domain-containing protein [Rhizobium sp. P32RR-XVIII]